MKKVLLLAYHYPPLGGVAVMRVLRFSRYLSEHGWKPYVVCVEGGAKHEPRDPGLSDEIPQDIVIKRVPCFEPDNYSDSWSKPREKVVRNVFKWFDKALFPDDRALWINPVVSAASKFAEQHEIDVIWATAQPWSTIVAGMKIKQKTGIPLVLDFRDDWTTSNSDFRKTKNLAREQALEQMVLSHADAVVSVTPHIVEQLRLRRPPGIKAHQIHYIPNGFDPAHFSARESQLPQSEGTFQILHAGGLYDKRPITPLLECLAAWFSKHPERQERVKVLLAGRTTPEIQEEILRSPMAQNFELLGFISHSEIRRLMQESDLNLLMIEQVKTAAWLFTGKVFEYVGAEKHILMLGPKPSHLATLLEETGLGTVCSYEVPEETAEVLEQLFQHRVPTLTEAHRQAIELYNAKHQAGHLAEILTEVTSS